MKRQFLILIALAAFTTALTTDAYGQTGKTMRANVKFDFRIADRIYPAGEYRIEPIRSEGNNILQIRSVSDVNKHEFILANYSDADKGRTSKLVFEKYGESYFLTHIFFESEKLGYSIRPSRGQRESETLLASRVTGNN